MVAKSLLFVAPLVCAVASRGAMCCSSKSLESVFSAAYVTVPSMDVAKTIAHGLVSNKLAACVNIIPQITSVYEWKGKITEDSELMLMIKTRTCLVESLTRFVRKNHPYTVCEVISLPIEGGNEPYLKWIAEVLPEESSGKKTTVADSEVAKV